MKKGFILLVTLFTIFACDKQNDKQSNNGLELTSSWKEMEHYYSIGGPVEWHTTGPKDAELIAFKKDNVFASTAHPHLNRYIVELTEGNSSAKLKLYEAGQTDTVRWVISNITPNSIDIALPGCIEGCGKRFKRID